MHKPLAGIKVLELARILAGPWIGQLLADLGADVVKVERPGVGDDTRSWGPPFVEGAEGGTLSASYFHSTNRGKRSVAADFETAEGQAVVKRLAAHADVVIENFKVGGLKKYGLDHEALSALNPRLITCSVTGFGQDGPYARRAGYDFMIQALGGLMSLTGEPDGLPMKTGVAITDVMTGLYAAVGVLAALDERGRTGVGRHIDVALLDVQVATLANQALNALVSGQDPRRHGNAHPNIVPYQAFACADGHLALTVGNDTQFARLARLLGRHEWAEDARFATNAARVVHRERLVPAIAELLEGRPRDAWLADFEAHAIPAGPINTLSQAFADPQVRHRGLLRRFERDGGEVPQVACPLFFDGRSATAEAPPPALGEHSEALLAELGLAPEQITRLRREGVIR